jgi:hypothetical protein
MTDTLYGAGLGIFQVLPASVISHHGDTESTEKSKDVLDSVSSVPLW